MSSDVEDEESQPEDLETEVLVTANEAAQGDTEERYFQLIAGALRVCARYKPKFGTGRQDGLTLEQFQRMYRTDPFYSWVGLDSPRVYGAHKAAGGITSIYRQLGMGTELVFRSILQDTLGLSADQATWSYTVPVAEGKSRTLKLDGRTEFDHVKDAQAKARLRQWVQEAGSKLGLASEMQSYLKGAVYEVRQGYKSKDSKRQNADIANSSSAYTNFYLPVVVLLSTQIDSDVAVRYTQARWLLLTGTTEGTTTNSTYVFCKDVLGFDLAAFFERNSRRIKGELEAVLTVLLEA